MLDKAHTYGPHLGLVVASYLVGHIGPTIGYFKSAWPARSCIGPCSSTRNRQKSRRDIK